MIHLVLGASGQVGAQLYDHLHGDDICLGTYHRNPHSGLDPLDLRDALSVERLMRDVRPDVCYLPAAYTHVDGAEQNPEECLAVNVKAVEQVTKNVARRGGLLVLFSTDHVFADGDTPWKEDDYVSPQSVYAVSKVRAESAVRQLLPDRHLIVRTSWVFGPDRQEKNFVHRVWKTLTAGERLRVSSDQHGQPTFAPDLATTTVDLVRRGTRGTYHVVGPRSLTKLEWARIIARSGELRTDPIVGVPTTPETTPTPRPCSLSLDRSKLLKTLGEDPIRDPEAGLLAMQRVPSRKKYGVVYP